MKKSDWLKDVKIEIDALKEAATTEELNNLNYKSFNPKLAECCIYGQITGNCANARAKELMDAACIRVMDFSGKMDEIRYNETFIDIKKYVNGKNEGQGWRTVDLGPDNIQYRRVYTHMSSLEAYIQLNGAKNKSIIQYLKGERDSLKL